MSQTLGEFSILAGQSGHKISIQKSVDFSHTKDILG